MIILLGEIVVSVGFSAADVDHATAGTWTGLLAGLVLAAALWWIYFDSAAGIAAYIVQASGGNPAMAYAIYAGGHLLPAFSLILMAAGVNLSLNGEPPVASAWLVTGGLASYLAGTRAFTAAGIHHWRARLTGGVAVLATASIAVLHNIMPMPAVIAVTAVWAVGACVLVSRRRVDVLRQLQENPLRFLNDR